MVPKVIWWVWRSDQLNVHCWKRSSALHWSIIMLVPLRRKHWPLLGFFRRFPWKAEAQKVRHRSTPNLKLLTTVLMRMAPCWFSPQQKSTPALVPTRCCVPSAGTLRFSPPRFAVWHGDNTPFRCYDESLWKLSIQSTAGGKLYSQNSKPMSAPLQITFIWIQSHVC